MSHPTAAPTPSTPTPPSTALSPHRPSEARRQCLNRELSVPLVSNFFSIDRYYEASEKVYESFQIVVQDGHLDDAYVYGKRYCLFCTEAIPQHNYYHSRKFAAQKELSLQRIRQVLHILEQVVARMDDEEMERQRIEREAQKQREIQLARERQEKLDRFQRNYAEQERMHRLNQSSAPSSSTSTSTSVEASALSKLEALGGTNGSRRFMNESMNMNRRDPSGISPVAPPSVGSSRYQVHDDSDDEHLSDLPPPIPPPLPDINGDSSSNNKSNGGEPPPPPSYEQIQSSSSRNFLGPAPRPYSSSLSHKLPLSSSSSSSKPQSPQQRFVPMRKLQDVYRAEYTRLCSMGKIRVTSLGTYQGRIHESTNGCTVISALVAANHMLRNNGNNGSTSNNSNGDCSSAITDAEVNHIIDNVTGPVLRQIRNKLGLGGSHALLIPSDVHDHLVDLNVLKQEYFAGASGGSVMDAVHMNDFLMTLSVGDSASDHHNHNNGTYRNCSAAATFFFSEHVISIVKYLNACTGQVNYDLIDSLPSSTHQGRATRTCCDSLESLRTLLNYYCSRKFSESHCTYIDTHKWEDSMADFDPRVFQGFVWMIKTPKQ